MADVTDRIKKRKEKEKEKENATGNPSPMPGTKEPEQPKEQPLPAAGDVNTPDAMPAAPAPQQPTAPSQESRMVSAAPNAMAQPGTSLTNLAKVDTSIDYDRTPEWAKMSYEDLVKVQPNVSRGQYAYALSNHRRQTGQPDLSYAEWQNIIKGNNPWETEKEKKTRERREKAAFLIDGIGGLLGNLVNYVRAKNGHVAMQGFDVGKAYNRYRQLQQGQQKLAQNNYQSYMDAIVRERAERAKQDAAAAALAAERRKYQHDFNMEAAKQANPYNQARVKTQEAQAEYYRTRNEGVKADNAYKPKKQAAELGLIGARTRQADAAADNSKGGKKYLELETPDGVVRYSPAENGSNWIQEAYNEMLTLSGKDKSPYKVKKLFGAGSEAPTDQEMYDAITRYNADHNITLNWGLGVEANEKGVWDRN